MLSLLILPSLFYFSQWYLPTPVAATTALNPSSGSNITTSNGDFLYYIPETPYAMKIRTFGSRSSLFSLVELQRLYDRTFTRINKHIDRGDGQSIPQRFVSNRWHFEMGWERIDGEHDRLVNFTMLKKIFLGLEGIHAKTDTPLVLVYRKPLRFFIEEWNGSELIIPGRGSTAVSSIVELGTLDLDEHSVSLAILELYTASTS